MEYTTGRRYAKESFGSSMAGMMRKGQETEVGSVDGMKLVTGAERTFGLCLVEHAFQGQETILYELDNKLLSHKL
jgi:hypothetical protein